MIIDPSLKLKEKHKELREKFYELFGEQYIKCVLFPLPPCQTREVIYMPDSFTSKTFDYGSTEHDYRERISIIKNVPTEFGPAILFHIKLRDLISPQLNVRVHAACARVSFRQLMTADDGTIFADECSLDSLSFGSSCNGASHVSIPKAPHLTALVQMERNISSNIFEQEFMYVSPDQAEECFLDEDFTPNLITDTRFSKLYKSINVLEVRSIYMGAWAFKYLSQFDRNLYKIGELQNEIECKGQILFHKDSGLYKGFGQSSNQSTGNQVLQG